MARILIVAPHPDDAEFAMGGAIALLAHQGHEVTILDLTSGEPTPFGTPEIRARETAAATLALTPPGKTIARLNLGLPNRTVVHDIASRHAVAGVIRRTRAEVLFMPYFEDAHPDHLAATRIIEDARFDAKLSSLKMPGDEGAPPTHPRRVIYYFATHLKILPQPSFLIDTSAFRAQKRAAVLAYESQIGGHTKNPKLAEMIEVTDRYFGMRLNPMVEAAEPFFVREVIGLTTLDII
ncbi:bacillithiol biosynthesis deacetylase BshB1 [soil metagenome]